MQRKMNRGYYIPLTTGTGGMILHFAYLPLLKYAHGANTMAYVAGAVHIAGGVFISMTFTAMTWVLSMEGNKRGAAWSMIGHIFLLLAIPLHSYGWHTLSEILYQSVVVVFAPVMLYFMVDVFRSYRPGGATADEWMRWRQDICDVVNQNDREVRAALAASEALLRQVLDAIAQAEEANETYLRHAEDRLKTAMNGEIANFAEAVEDAAKRKQWALNKQAQRAKDAPGPAIQNDSKLAESGKKDAE